MTFPKTITLAALLAAGLGAGATAQEAAATEEAAPETAPETAAADVTAETVVATVGGIDITVGHMIVARKTLPEQYAQLPPEVLWEGILEQLVQQNALALEAGEPSKETVLMLENQRTGYLAGDVLEAAALASVTEEALEAKYEEIYAEAEPQREWNAAHILVETEEEAQAVKEEVEGGADFAEVAKVKSTGPSGPNGGALGWFGAGMMVPEFETAVMAMKAGEVSAPVKTQFGWHVIKLNETRLKDKPDMAAVRDQLAEEVQRAAVDEAIASAVEKAGVEKAEAEIPASVLNDFDLLED
ncbi:peptidylprolyl isomerase [Vannielia litorea]|uniref:Parvulin-like PPIase n=1 Tax=Vannielia litorea TaxID=1217970 RepID=A0A1N6HI00_9RHOB|nr:peptidylprolyl isomerase [Vannielia litorea]SIO19357.1 peptidyl-prolyl cis-trans isomerase C [Vannielia litorea]